ncbi:la-related protein 7-like isoform X2 [Ornithodoros turicata]
MGDVSQQGVTFEDRQSPATTTNNQKKRDRRRKKKLYKDIREQMEFYFSDANLRKDRYMSELVQKREDGYINLEVFLTFSKIKSHTNSVVDIAAALANSTFLQLNEDKTQVRRMTAVEDKEDTDDCTIYVERLPPTADHRWLKTTFDKHGKVVYVSLPKYRHNGKMKGFAFVEFSTPDEVEKVCQAFGFVSPCVREVDLPEEQDESHSRKRKLSETQEDTKPPKLPKGSEKTNDERERLETLVEEGSATEEGKASNKKLKRKRKKKLQHLDAKEQNPLLVMPKWEWKRLRNKYLALQKQTMAQIKRSLLPASNAYHSPRNVPSPSCASPADDTPVPSAATVVSTEPEGNTKLPVPPLEFQANVIVKLTAEKPITSAVEFKNNLRHLTYVSYVDVMEGDTVAYVRCPDEDSAKKFIRTEKQSFCGSLALLSGDEEREYWKKINQDRKTRRSQKTKQKKRGVEKVMAKAQKLMEKKSKHTHFEDL